MTKNFKLIILSVLFIFTSSIFLAQTSPETPAKTGDAPKKEEDEFAKKKTETKLSEVIPTDSLAASELIKRAVAWIKLETDKYKKSSGTTTGSKAECSASFPVKPKELNPEVDYTGKVVMKVVIECKDSKYRYTISEIKHVSKSGNTSAGSIDNAVPDCGSMSMNDLVWKKLKGEALRDAAQVVQDLKAGMGQIVTEAKPEEW
jgi:hypothetical protein